MSAQRKELVEELNDLLDSLNDIECHNIAYRVPQRDLVKLITAIRKAKEDAVEEYKLDTSYDDWDDK